MERDRVRSEYRRGTVYIHPRFEGRGIRGYLPIESVVGYISEEEEKRHIMTLYGNIVQTLREGGSFEVGQTRIEIDPNCLDRLELHEGKQPHIVYTHLKEDRARTPLINLERFLGHYMDLYLAERGVNHPTFNSRTLARNFIVEAVLKHNQAA